MNFKEWLISEEIFPNKIATVYHRTCPGCDEEKSVQAVSGILTSDFKVGAGCMYGCGFYTTFAIESQFTNYMETYGKAVVKFKVTDLDKYLIFQLSVAKQIHGKDYKISDQLKKLGVLNKVDESKLKEYDEQQEKEKYSSVLAYEFYEQNKWMAKSVKGIIYYGANDGYCLVKYEPVQDGTITMLAYAVSEHNDMKKMEELKNPKSKNWIISTDKASVKSIYKSPISNREKFSFSGDDNADIVDRLLKSKNVEYTVKKLGSNLNKLSQDNVRHLLTYATDKDKMAEAIIKYKKELSDKDVYNLLNSPSNKDKIAKIIIEKKLEELSDGDVLRLLLHSIKKDEIAELIIKKKPELSNQNIFDLLLHSIKKEEIAGILQKEKDNISKLSDFHVRDLIARVTEKDEMLKIIIKYKPELSEDNVYYFIFKADDKDKIIELIINKLSKIDIENGVRDLIRYAKDQEKIAEYIIKKEPELSDDGVYRLLVAVTDKPKIAQIINKYHTNKTSEIQELIDKYLEPQAIAAK